MRIWINGFSPLEIQNSLVSKMSRLSSSNKIGQTDRHDARGCMLCIRSVESLGNGRHNGGKNRY